MDATAKGVTRAIAISFVWFLGDKTRITSHLSQSAEVIFFVRHISFFGFKVVFVVEIYGTTEETEFQFRKKADDKIRSNSRNAIDVSG